jgi:hypothetical protein
MKANKKKYLTNISLIWLGCAIILFFAYMLVIEPQRKERETVAAQLAKQIKAYEEAKKANDEEILAKEAAELDDLQAKLEDHVVDFADSANLTFDISEIAAKQQIDAFSIKSRENRSANKATEFNFIDEDQFDVSLTADFNRFATFMNALERHDPTLLVDGFSIARSEDMTAGHQAKLNLAVLVKKKENN